MGEDPSAPTGSFHLGKVKSHLAEEQEGYPTRLGGGQTGTRIKAGSEDNRRVVALR